MAGHRRRVRTPLVLQLEAVECGAAALGTVLAYHGRQVPLEELRAACGVSRDGSKANRIVAAARAYGLLPHAYRREPEGLRDLPLPAILFWNLNHFVVLEGFGSGCAFLNDPALGHRRVSLEEFDGSFTGIVLTFEPGPGFRPGGARQRLLPALAAHLPGTGPALAFAVLAGVLLVIPGLVVPALTQVFVNDVLVGQRHHLILPLLAGLGLAALVQVPLAWLQALCLLRLRTRLAVGSAARLFWHVLRLPLPFFAQRYPADVAARVALVDRLASLLSGELAAGSLNALLAVLFLGLMLRYDGLLTAVAAAAGALDLGALLVLTRQRTDLAQRLLQEQSRLLGVVTAGLQSIETLKSSAREDDLFVRLTGHQANLLAVRQQYGWLGGALEAAPVLSGALGTAAVLSLGGLRVMEGQMSLGALVAFQGLLLSFLRPVQGLVGFGGRLQQAQADLQRLDDVLGTPPDLAAEGAAADGEEALTADGAGPPPGELTGHLELRGVTFGYSRLDPPLLQDFSLVLRPGERKALVGATGSGKSTVARLVAGLYEPWSGAILLDGLPLREVPRAIRERAVAVVDQEIFLFAGDVRENLTLWDETVPDQDLVAAAQDAAVHAEVAGRPGGYAACIAEGGLNWSGGQRQRLEIARALATNPALLVLDEATSALDPGTEQRVDAALRRRGCSCLIIAHRLSTVRDCDEILVLQRGRVVERGTHATLVAAGGRYAELISVE